MSESEQVAPDMLRTSEAVQELQSVPEAPPESDVEEGLLQENTDSEMTDILTKLPSEAIQSTETENLKDQSDLDKTAEDDSSELTNSRKSRELKSLLALSKEAKLDTNLSRKRKTLEGLKLKESTKSPAQPDSEVKKPVKVTLGNNFKFPVTAEAELEQDSQEITNKASSDNSINYSKLKRKRDSLGEAIVGGATEDAHRKNRKRSASELKMFKWNKDIFCWRCHREGVNVVCETCPRSYHQRCLKQTISDVEHWPCPECVAILKAESTHTRSEAMKGMSLEHLCSLLKFALSRMMICQGSEPFLHPVNDAEFPEYQKYIIQPMDLTKLKNNIKGNYYGSTQAFEADAKWILHNSIIFNSYQSKLTYSAKNIIKICKQEMAEIENCPSCYLNANTKKNTWFVEVCPRPHLLVWAKLKGFPYWPAKAMSCTSSGMVDVRFFGAHDRAWVHYKECFLYSEKDPNTFKQKRYDIEKCVEELNIYINNLRKVYGEFRHASYRTPLDPDNMGKQMLISIPKYKSMGKRRKSLKPALDEIKTEPKPEENEPQEEKTQQQSPQESETAVGVEHAGETEKNCQPQPEETKTDYPISEPYSNRTTPVHDLDTTMEGYGTDDDSVAEIDLERRKAFVEKGKMEEEDEDDNDTQVPSNISLDGNASKSGFKRAGSGGGTPGGKTKITQRRKSEVENTQKRVSSEEIFPSQRKTSRRNSDMSVKSDSSRMSNISDKINRVDISENMEISLGNEDISISDNVSPPNGETSKSSSECSFEHKRKPVQVDIDNAEFTISPSNKLKISDQLMKRLSDAKEKAEEVKKSVFEVKSPTDTLIEKLQVGFQQQEVESSEPSTSDGTTNQEEHTISDYHEADADELETNGEIVPPKKMRESEQVIDTTKEFSDILPEKQVMESAGEIVPVEEVMESEEDIVPHKEAVGKESEEEVMENEASMLEMEESSRESGDMKQQSRGQTPDLLSKKLIQPAITDFTMSIFKPTAQKHADTNLKMRTELVNIVESIVEEDVEEEREKKSMDSIQLDKKNIFNIIHSSLNEGKNKTDRDSTNKQEHEKLETKITETHSTKNHLEVETPKQAALNSETAVKSQDPPKSDSIDMKIDSKPAPSKSKSPMKSPEAENEILETDDEPVVAERKISIKSPKSDLKTLDTDDKTAKSEGAIKSKDSPKSDSKHFNTNNKPAATSDGVIKSPKSDSKALETEDKPATSEHLSKSKDSSKVYSRSLKPHDKTVATRSESSKKSKEPSKSNPKSLTTDDKTSAAKRECIIKSKDLPKPSPKSLTTDVKPAADRSESATKSKDPPKSNSKLLSTDDKPVASKIVIAMKSRDPPKPNLRSSTTEEKMTVVDSEIVQKSREPTKTSKSLTSENRTTAASNDSATPSKDPPKSDSTFLITNDRTATAKSESTIKSKDNYKTATAKSESTIKSKDTPKSNSKLLLTVDKTAAAKSESILKSKDPPKSHSRHSITDDEPDTAKSETNIKSKSSSNSSTTDDKTAEAVAKSEKAIKSKHPSKSESKLSIKIKPTPSSQTRQKRPSSDEPTSPPSKILKLVPIDSIINQKEAEAPVLSKNAPLIDNTTAMEIVVEPVKSEPDSDDDFSENENLEAKRQYLSALNISEKTDTSDANKAPEIRTRAKAEERREKYRKVDNLTKVIDDVALNYTPEGKGHKTPPKKLERRKSLGGSIPPEGEIYVKSFAKLQSGGKQRARKTFPTPSYVKPPVKIVLASKKEAAPSSVAAKKDNSTPIVITKKDVASFPVVKKPVAAVSAAQSPGLIPVSKPHITTLSNSTSIASTASTKNAQLSLPDTSNAVCNSDGGVLSPVANLVQAQKPMEANVSHMTNVNPMANVNNMASLNNLANVNNLTNVNNMATVNSMNNVSNMTHVILMPTPTINYCTPLANPFMNTQVAMALPTAPALPPAPPTAPNTRTSQNYVPQGDTLTVDSSPDRLPSPNATGHLLSELLTQAQPEPTDNVTSNGGCADAVCADAREPAQEDEFAVLNTIVPDSVSRAVSDLLLRPPPRLRPRPPGMLSTTFEEGIPSTAGDVTAKINSIAHRMTDYFRGMLIETMADLGRAANPEARIINLQVEIESLKHKHNLELSEMRQNVCTILKDVQRSIVEDRERVKDEARASCEAEAIKRIESAKSKQWCANCSKEAQFYCCWNTSYCDYPCQQKHWAQHMGKCTQNIEKTSSAAPSMSRPAGQPIILRPAAPPKPGVGRIVAKPTKVYLNRASSPQKVFKTVASSGNHITVIETTPGNYELVGNGPIAHPGTKFYSMGSNVFTKLKTTTATAPSVACPSAAQAGGPRISAAETSRAPAHARAAYAMPVTTVLEED
ncbi:unnamed protein product [Phaedon cochleariae]|uniref:Protein kinase C-binding protein 1 n=1 Tax=Phaedon cochleariae TaxID=80249 RepID=A0A9P0DYJ1_PHACE|nr:unnamed protein product [Phaedon cochleariae]